MRNFFAVSSLVLFLTPLGVPLGAQDAAAVKLPPQILTNQGVVALSDAGYDEDFLIDLIQSRQTRFDTSVEGLSYLAQHGLCEHVVRMMVARANTHEQHTVVAAPVSPVAIPARVGKREVLLAASAAVQPGVQMVPLADTGWIHGAGFPVPQSAPAVPYQVVRRRRGLFGHRWYLVQPGISIPAALYPLPTRNPVSIPAAYTGPTPSW